MVRSPFGWLTMTRPGWGWPYVVQTLHSRDGTGSMPRSAGTALREREALHAQPVRAESPQGLALMPGRALRYTEPRRMADARCSHRDALGIVTRMGGDLGLRGGAIEPGPEGKRPAYSPFGVSHAK